MLTILSGALVTAMIIVQLAVVQSTVPAADAQLSSVLVHRIRDVSLGMDVAFDRFIGLGTVFFGFAMLTDRRFGRILGWLGIVVGLVVILGFNLATFPDPPVEAGLFDPGPVTGLWHLSVVIQMTRYLVRLRRGASTTEGQSSPGS